MECAHICPFISPKLMLGHALRVFGWPSTGVGTQRTSSIGIFAVMESTHASLTLVSVLQFAYSVHTTVYTPQLAHVVSDWLHSKQATACQLTEKIKL